MAVSAGTIVEHLDVVEDVCFGQVTGFVDPFLDPLLFQAAEERLSNRIISAVTPSTHARLQVVGFQKA